MPLPSAAIGLGHDPRNTDEDRHGTERSELVERVEGGVGFLGERHDAGCQADRSHQGHDEQSDTIGRCRLRLRDRRVEDAKLSPLLTLLHALGDLGLFEALREGLIELTRTFVVTRELLELLFPPRYVLDPGLVGRDSFSEPLILALEDPDLCLDLAQSLFQSEHIRCDRGGLWRGWLFPCRVPGLGVGKLALERGDLRRQQDDIWVLLTELGAELCQLLFQPGEAELGALGRGGWPTRHPGR